jgi:hypothetical protein
MLFGALVIGDGRWWWPALLLVICAAALLWWSYRGAVVSLGMAATSAGLKTLGVALLAVCLVEPLWSGVRAKPGANVFAVLVDRSGSLQIRDQSRGPTRAELLERVLADDHSNWQARLGQDFDVRRYVFGQRLEQVDDFNSIRFDGSQSGLKSALESLRERLAGRPLAGVLLFTDGNATDWDANSDLPAGLPPLYPVLMGQGAPRDISIGRTAVTQTSFEDAPVTIQADVHSTGYDGAEIVAQLCDESGAVVQAQTQDVTAERR